MNTINSLMDAISPMTRLKWILPGLIALAHVTAFLGVTGCSPPHH